MVTGATASVESSSRWNGMSPHYGYSLRGGVAFALAILAAFNWGADRAMAADLGPYGGQHARRSALGRRHLRNLTPGPAPFSSKKITPGVLVALDIFYSSVAP
jgi:hypothetical protein